MFEVVYTCNFNFFNTFYYCRWNKIVATALSLLVISINIYFLLDKVSEYSLEVKIAVGIFMVLYLIFCLYLIIHMAISMGAAFLNYVSVSIV